MNACPCCSNSMLRHVRHHEVYWFCRSCWQEMPLIESSPSLMLLSSSFERRFASCPLPRSLATL
ncbi:hypothetical protein C7B82_28250 [Stenomitos frigidus ULC18]|uniref:Uncharacterized protein n=1 Tax=Stenomitos frigidus ULC18 TaxID=2107698 RepID=A0A2T1DUH9_9CYAN|nr:hypothetical protein C7B82_28250 [Stenomitos frigidus ULC18]